MNRRDLSKYILGGIGSIVALAVPRIDTEDERNKPLDIRVFYYEAGCAQSREEAIQRAEQFGEIIRQSGRDIRDYGFIIEPRYRG